jgi:SsrA-binding protein
MNIFNRRANYDYEILEKFEGGLVLKGYEVKAIKTGKASLKGAYVVVQNNEVFLINAHISPYQKANTPNNYQPDQTRKILLHKSEIKSLIGKTKQKGLTLVPIKMYTKKGRIKLQFGLGKGKRKFDKREAIARKEAKRRIERAMRES